MKQYKFVGTQKDADKYSGIWCPAPKVGEIYDGECQSFCPNDSPVYLLAKFRPNDWELIK